MAANYQHTFADRHFLGRLSEELSEIIARQSRELMREKGITIPPKSCSLMVAIEQHQPASARMLADVLQRSHQLVSQKLPKLIDLELLEVVPNPKDRREKFYALTAHGERQMALFHRLQPQLEAIYTGLFNEVGDVAAILRAAISALEDKPLHQRAKAQVV